MPDDDLDFSSPEMMDVMRPVFCPICNAVLQERRSEDGEELFCEWCDYCEAA